MVDEREEMKLGVGFNIILPSSHGGTEVAATSRRDTTSRQGIRNTGIGWIIVGRQVRTFQKQRVGRQVIREFILISRNFW
jgi:hypothetical protein